MAENETQATGSRADGTAGFATTNPDIIKGWNDKRKSNNQIISSMVPFVQLIGIFDEKEYEKMFRMTDSVTNVVYDDGTGRSDSYNQKYPVDRDKSFDDIKKQIGARFFNLYLVKSIDYGMNVQAINGIMMAEGVSQIKDASGGIGITDLQVEYGKDGMGSRRYNLRLTINDPKILDEKMEYTKFAATRSEFLIIYGWSNPEVIPSYDAAMPPPKFEDDPRTVVDGVAKKQRLIVPLRDLGNGGYWSADRVHITNYEFGFNEMGKLEINTTLRDNSAVSMYTTPMSSIAKTFKAYLNSGELNKQIEAPDGNEFTWRDALAARQQELNAAYTRLGHGKEGGATQADHAQYVSQWDQAIKDFAGQTSVTVRGQSADEASPIERVSYITEEDVREKTQEARTPQKGYPEQNAIYTYKQIFETVLDENPPEEADHGDDAEDAADENGVASSLVPTKQVVSYEKRAAYYFLGALMDSVSVSIATSAGGLGTSKVPSFFYRDINKDSALATAFQSKMKSVNRATGMEERIQEAIIRLKERFLPPTPVMNIKYGSFDLESRLAEAAEDLGSTPEVASTRVIYEGFQSRMKDRVIEAIFPPPPRAGNLVGAPMRGWYLKINTNHYNGMLRAKGLEGFGEVYIFLPDWKQEISFDPEGNEIESSGHPDGFDPLNPTEYRAAMPRPPVAAPPPRTVEFDGETIALDGEYDTPPGPSNAGPFAPGFEGRSQDPYGRGGRFYMIKSFEATVTDTESALGQIGGGISLGEKREKRRIISYNVWRYGSKETWNLLQKQWHNMYREYLAAYFEKVVRERISQLEPFGIPVEAIFNEPIDLDWMTGMVYRNTSWKNREPSENWLKPWDEVAGTHDEDMDVGTQIAKTEQEAAKYQTIIDQKTLEIEGESGGLEKASADIVANINALKLEIEQLTGGKYQRNIDGEFDTEDVMGNTIMLRFKNFLKIVASDEVEEEVRTILFDPETRQPTEAYVRTLKPEIEYERIVSSPTVKEEWILWSEFKLGLPSHGDIGVPTNNFQHRWNMEKNDWEDSLNKAEKWKERNASVYENTVLPKVNEIQQLVYVKLNGIDELQTQLSDVYDEYEEARVAIENARRKIADGERTLQQFREFFNTEGELELSLYDDTSDFDGDGIKVDVGRAEPMHLTTRVAQQWYRRFAGALKRGVMDVANYGPPQGGKQYWLPTNNYEFKFDLQRRSHGVMGQPTRVLDPEFLLTLKPSRGYDLTTSWQWSAKTLLSNLSYGTEGDVTPSQIISKNLPYGEVAVDYGTKKSYHNWSVFGTPGIPNENGNNEWGFRYGPPYERTLGDDTIEQLGGNYVRSYKDFLNLFGAGYNPDWPESLRIIGSWPMPMNTPDHGVADATALAKNSSIGLPMYTVIDEMGNLLVDDDNGWYKPSGWMLEFAGEPVMLYPSRETACRINNSNEYKDGVRPGGVLQMGLNSGVAAAGNVGRIDDRQKIGAGWDDGHRAMRQRDGKYTGRQPTAGQSARMIVSSVVTAWAESWAALLSGDLKGYIKQQKSLYTKGLKSGAFGGALTFGLFTALKSNSVKYLNDGYMVDYLGNKTTDHRGPWGGRIGEGEHCMNLTLAMKQSMIYHRPNLEDPTRFLGTDMAGGGDNGDPANMHIDWSLLVKNGEYYVFKNNPNRYAEYDRYETTGAREEIVEGRIIKEGEVIQEGTVVQEASAGISRPAKGATVIGPKINKQWPPYSNPEYPYGTGWYNSRSQHRGLVHGPYVFPSKMKNWVDWGDLLQGLPGKGFLNQIDNSNYSPCLVQPTGKITDGLEMNEGFVKFIIENVFAPLPKNRRTMARDDHKRIKIRGDHENDDVGGYETKYRLHDTTYQDLFGPLQDDDEDDEAKPAETALAPTNFGNIDNFSIENVKSIPIRREVVDNLVNKNNRNISVAQFFGEILRPGSIGVNSGGNTHVALRQGTDGSFEVFCPSSIDWQKMVDQYAYLWGPALDDEDAIRKKFPKDIVVLDFKASDSLIENIDMNSAIDPTMGKALRDSSVDFTGSTDALINFLSYKDIAADLQEFFDTDELSKDFASDAEGKVKAITIEVDGTVKVNKGLLLKEDGSGAKEVVTTAVSRFLANNPARLNAIRNLTLASQSGEVNEDGSVTQRGNYATQLMSNYMRKTTITIHGTTNIAPFQTVIVKGVMPNLEGMYRINSVRDSITPQGFQTILEGTLLRPPSDNARINSLGGNEVPVEQHQEGVEQIRYSGTLATQNVGSVAMAGEGEFLS